MGCQQVVSPTITLIPASTPEVIDSVFEGMPVCFTLERDLYEGVRYPEVNFLQVILNSDPDTRLTQEGAGSSGEETDYFGSLTKAAVKRFQEKYAPEILAPLGLKEGTGYVGPTTRAKLNQILLSTAVPCVGSSVLGPGSYVDVPEGAKDLRLLQLKVINTSSLPITINTIVVETSHLEQVRLYGSKSSPSASVSVDPSNHRAVLSSLNWVVGPGCYMTLPIGGDLSKEAVAGSPIHLDVTVVGANISLAGDFPISASRFWFAGHPR